VKQLNLILSLAIGMMLGGAAYGQNTSSESSQSSTTTSKTSTSRRSATSNQNTQTVPRTPERVRTSRTDVLPSGTQLAIRTNENIKATQADSGKTYSAEVARTIEDQNGNMLVPKGSPVALTIASVKNSTLGENQAELALHSITVHGHRYLVSTNTVTQQGTGGIGKNKKTAEMVGGGALLGTVIGAVAGGGKGAAIGAVVGGAGGAGAQVLTKGKQVKVPAESVLTFQLSQPIQLQR
jgi:ribosome-binding protein aMBF1 (putative translation factor)